jgi:hypothetical protein
VHHVKEFHGLNDPLRLDRNNLRVTHFRCHMRHTATGHPAEVTPG